MSHWQKHFLYYDKFQLNNRKYLEMLNYLANSANSCFKVLDSGAGTGNLTNILLNNEHEVIALDNNKFALNILKNKCSSANLKIIKTDLNKDLPFADESFDAVLSSFVLPYVKDFEHYFTESCRVLKAGGVLASSVLMPRKGIIDYILNSIKHDEIEKELIQEHPDWWQEIEKTSRVNETKILRNGRSQKEVLKFLEAAGFANIAQMTNNPYEDYVLIFKASKKTEYEEIG